MVSIKELFGFFNIIWCIYYRKKGYIMKQLTKAEEENLLTILKERFEKNGKNWWRARCSFFR